MCASLIKRTMRTNIVLYKSNGKDRDSYIIYNNGGFWKDIKPINQNDNSFRQPFKSNHSPGASPGKTPPVWTYHSDGSGRDTYILYNGGGLIKKFKSMAEKLKNFLRNDEYDEDSKINMSFVNRKKPLLLRDEKLYLKKINKIQKDLIDRLYNKVSLRKKIMCNDKYKLNDNNNNISFDFKNQNQSGNSIIIEPKEIKKNLNRSSSQIYTKKYLEPIKDKINNKDLCNSLFKKKNKLILNKKFMNSNSMSNIFRKKLKINNDVNINKYNLKRKFFYNAFHDKMTKGLKINCDNEPKIN